MVGFQPARLLDLIHQSEGFPEVHSSEQRGETWGRAGSSHGVRQYV